MPAALSAGCEPAQYAHSHAIIHRDLKPSNILVSADGQVKLLDFGIAKHLDFEEGPVERKLTGLRLMTPAYAAPEQMDGRAVGVYTDVFALRVLLYEVLTGRLPQNSGTPDSTGEQKADTNRAASIEKPSRAIRRDKPGVRRELSRSEWADLDVMLLKALDSEIDRRYRTVGGLIRDLDAFLEGRPLEAQPNSLSYTAGKFVRRHRRALASVAAMLLLIFGTVIFYTARVSRACSAAVQEPERTRRIQQFIESLFEGGDQAAGPAMDLKAVDLLDRGRQEAASLSADPEMQADMQETLGGIYQKLGKPDLAAPLLASALEERRKTSNGNTDKLAESMVALGLLRRDQGKLDDAEKLVVEGLALQQTASASTPESVRSKTGSMVALGSVLEVRGKYDEAKQILESALKLQPAGLNATAETSRNLTELANVDFYQGHDELSESLNHQALEIDRRIFGEEHPSVAQEFNNLGAIEFDRGKYPTSEAYYRQALAITEKWYGDDHPETAANLTALAQPITLEDREAEAQGLLERALAIQKRVNGPVNSTVATTLNQLGIVAFRAKQYDAARSYFTQAMDSWRQLYGDQHRNIAVAYYNLGSVCLEEKDLPCAEKNYREAIRRLDAISPGSMNAAVAHGKPGRTLLRQGRFADAETDLLAAYKYLVNKVPAANSYLFNARKDLASVYDSLHDTTKAAQFRSGLNAAASSH